MFRTPLTRIRRTYSIRFSDLSVVFLFLRLVHSRFRYTCLPYGKFYAVLFTFQVIFMRNFETRFATRSVIVILRRRLFAMNSPRFAAFTTHRAYHRYITLGPLGV